MGSVFLSGTREENYHGKKRLFAAMLDISRDGQMRE
jgi:hypothetical protein